MDDAPQELVTLAQEFARRRRISLARIGLLAANDGKFFDALLKGGDVRTRTYAKVKAYLTENMPPDDGVAGGAAAEVHADITADSAPEFHASVSGDVTKTNPARSR